MESAIWKFPLGVTHKDQKIQMPVGATILCLQTKDGKPTIWAEVNKNAATEERTFRIYGTGHELPPIRQKYIGTVQDWELVWHIYEIFF